VFAEPTNAVTTYCRHVTMTLIDWIYKLPRWVIGAVFVHAGGLKLADPGSLAVLIDAYGLVPDPLLTPIAVVLPAFEVAAGIGLILDIKGSLTTVVGLLVLFLVILGYGMGMGLDVDCGCFGPEDPEAKAFHGLKPAFYRDLAMLGVTAFLYGWRRYRTIEPVALRALVNRF